MRMNGMVVKVVGILKEQPPAAAQSSDLLADKHFTSTKDLKASQPELWQCIACGNMNLQVITKDTSGLGSMEGNLRHHLLASRADLILLQSRGVIK